MPARFLSILCPPPFNFVFSLVYFFYLPFLSISRPSSYCFVIWCCESLLCFIKLIFCWTGAAVLHCLLNFIAGHVSIAGTPGWDPATHGWTPSRSVGGTPGVNSAEMVDNYFDAKKRSGHRASGSNGVAAQTTPVRMASRKAPGHEGKSQTDDRKLRFDAFAQEVNSPRRPLEREKMSGKLNEVLASSQRPEMRHNKKV